MREKVNLEVGQVYESINGSGYVVIESLNKRFLRIKIFNLNNKKIADGKIKYRKLIDNIDNGSLKLYRINQLTVGDKLIRLDSNLFNYKYNFSIQITDINLDGKIRYNSYNFKGEAHKSYWSFKNQDSNGKISTILDILNKDRYILVDNSRIKITKKQLNI